MRPVSPLTAAVTDVTQGFRLMPVWWRLSLEQTFSRYRRTLLGPLWIASGTLATGLSIAFVFGPLLGGSFRESLPHILGGILAWSLVSGVVVEGSGAFMGSAGMLQVQRLPLSFCVMLVTSRVMINFLHQVVAFWVMMALFRLLTVPHWSLLLALPTVALAGLSLAVPVGMISARYRDVHYLIQTIFGALFLLTPVFWNRAQLSEDKRWIADYNIFSHLLEILRQPFLGQAAPTLNWLVSFGVIGVGALLTIGCLAAFRKRVIFWL